MNILIVDDSRFLRTILKNMLTSMGFTETYEAANGLEAVRKAHILQPDLIFMNLIMPEMDGYEASKHILKNFETKIVIMSSNSISNTPLKDSDLGVHGYVSIPFTNSTIKKVLGKNK